MLYFIFHIILFLFKALCHPIARAVSTPISERARTALEEVRSIRSAVVKCLCLKDEEEEEVEKGVVTHAEGSGARTLDLSGASDVGQKEGVKEVEIGEGQEVLIGAKKKNKKEEEEEEEDYRNLDREIYSDLCSVHIVMQKVRHLDRNRFGEGRRRDGKGSEGMGR